jgi:hypothetical protein
MRKSVGQTSILAIAIVLAQNCIAQKNVAEQAEESETKISSDYSKACGKSVSTAERGKALLQMFRDVTGYAGQIQDLNTAIDASNVLTTKEKAAKKAVLQKRKEWIDKAGDYCDAFPFDTSGIATISKAADPGSADTTDSKENNNEKISFIAGFEQSGVSSLPTNSGAFVRVFSRSNSLNKIDGFGDTRIWGQVRVLSVPAASTEGVISTFTDPSGAVKNLDIKQVGSSIDYVIGTETKLFGGKGSSDYSGHFITFFGATTPFSSEDVIFRYKAPAQGTAECTQLIQKFSPVVAAGPVGGNCLANNINFIAFNRQDRSSFLRKAGFGFRTKTRLGPDQSGVVDATFGLDESVTGGQLRHWVFKLEGVHPLNIPNFGFLYLFGSASIRLQRNFDQSTLILSSATPTEAPVPSPNVLLIPLRQPNRDFYRIGIGFDFLKLFKDATTTR